MPLSMSGGDVILNATPRFAGNRPKALIDAREGVESVSPRVGLDRLLDINSGR